MTLFSQLSVGISRNANDDDSKKDVGFAVSLYSHPQADLSLISLQNAELKCRVGHIPS